MEANKCLNKLFEARDTTHVMHLQTKNYNEHLVLGGFYEGLGCIVDSYAEQYQGSTGETITDIGVITIAEGSMPVSYLEEFRDKLLDAHKKCEYITVKLVIENALTLTNKTLYLLKLK